MAYPLLKFYVWDGSANIVTRHLPIHRIGLRSEESGVVLLDLIVCHRCHVQAQKLGLHSEEIKASASSEHQPRQ